MQLFCLPIQEFIREKMILLKRKWHILDRKCYSPHLINTAGPAFSSNKEMCAFSVITDHRLWLFTQSDFNTISTFHKAVCILPDLLWMVHNHNTKFGWADTVPNDEGKKTPRVSLDNYILHTNLHFFFKYSLMLKLLCNCWWLTAFTSWEYLKWARRFSHRRYLCHFSPTFFMQHPHQSLCVAATPK